MKPDTIADVAGTRTTARVSRAALREAIAAARQLLRELQSMREAKPRKLARRARR